MNVADGLIGGLDLGLGTLRILFALLDDAVV